MEEESNPALSGATPPVFKPPIPSPGVPRPQGGPPMNMGEPNSKGEIPTSVNKTVPKSAPPVPPLVPRTQQRVPVTAPLPAPSAKSIPVTAPSTVVPVHPATPEVSSLQSEVTIRTMQDDLRDIKQGVSRPSAKATPQKNATQPTPATTARTFPLPPKNIDQKKQKVVLAPTVTRRRGRGVRLLGILFILLVLGGGGGAAAWYFYLQDLPLFQAEVVVAEARQVLPAEYQLLLQYQLTSVQDRTDLAAAWESTGVPASLATLIEGDARLLLSDAAIKEFYYVVLEDTLHPYLVVPKTPETTQLIVGGADVRYIEREGWYIVHQLAIGAYENALASGVMATGGIPALLRADSTPQSLRLLVGAAALPELRKSSAGSEVFGAGLLKELALSGSYRPSTQSFSWSGTATSLQPLTAAVANQELLQVQPSTFSTTRLGANFYEDVQQWVALAPGIDSDLLGRPLIQQFMKGLTGSYLFYTIKNTTGVESVGLVIELPPELKGKIVVPAQAIEEAMPAVLPLILDRRTVAPLTFSNGTYAGIALRYANISGTNKALDYAVTPDYIIIATSKDSMFALLDTLSGTKPGALLTAPWQSLNSAWGALQPSRDVVMGSLSTTSLQGLLPVAPGATTLFGLQLQPDALGNKVQLITQGVAATTISR